ncbi:MAG TPA: SDR family oxidoreductase [Acidimicrobiales bacterium]|jgi:NAD(P)-dependent dehydrogenase (short-subunit alcohol dehydrogenase family)|nr:SDR family oxidoreductase [Acidimicrobiales bacterium]
MERTVFITGTSTGIGEAAALHLDRAGYRVFAGVRKEADGQRLTDVASQRLRTLLVDVTDVASVEAAAKAVAAEVGDAGLGALVNNAGVAMGGPIEYLDLDDWRRQLEVNVVGQVAVTKSFLPLIRQGSGRIIFIGSIGGRVAAPFVGPYSASKFAVEAIAESLRQELEPWAIPVTVIEPGAVKTPIWAKGQSQADDIEAAMPPEARERYGPAVQELRRVLRMQDRMGIPPQRVAEAIARVLTARTPPTRLLVGRDAKAGALLVRLAPDRTRDAILRTIRRRA